MRRATRYRCRRGHDKFVPEPPLNPDPRIRTGCEVCGGIVPHRPVGTGGWSA
jgi:hypothetical protein